MFMYKPNEQPVNANIHLPLMEIVKRFPLNVFSFAVWFFFFFFVRYLLLNCINFNFNSILFHMLIALSFCMLVCWFVIYFYCVFFFLVNCAEDQRFIVAHRVHHDTGGMCNVPYLEWTIHSIREMRE